MQDTTSETIPATLVIEELDSLQSVLDQCLAAYRAKLTADLCQLRAAVLQSAQNASLTTRQLRDLRDMLILCRNIQLKPEKGRRKDLKAVESLVEQLQLLKETW